MLDKGGGNVSLIWVVEPKTALADMLYATERIPLKDLIKWLTTKAKKLQNERWSTCNNEMRERKGKAVWSKDTYGLGRWDQVKKSSVRIKYCKI
jgi:hypothetical protein